MLVEKLYHHIEQSPKLFLIVTMLTIVFFSGISFTFVVPGLKGFSLFFTFLTLFIYLIVAIIFAGLMKKRIASVFVLSILLSGLGMGWRLWLEWGEYSLVEHMNPAVYIGYPIVSAIFVALFYHSANRRTSSFEYHKEAKH
ncbi:ABC transporter permease [Gracilibacillus salinarum]|uniref:ABC transporter permease n=1 Tax=Gracilibacillus salinarum TaxID=2932255 RepID=A0ABY4GRA3_9BACI|nr:ABC transporter permease [Gracilibacillus salinarum]UOQ86890.1 ABC transporter permease [Gracilibacillus salinarum]